jgi:hypothetical protein
MSNPYVDIPFVPFVKEGTWNIPLTYGHFLQIEIRDIGMDWVVEGTYCCPCADDNRTVKTSFPYGSVSFADICLNTLESLLED